jgi:TRAP-type mannitol/chloroaromatic compound transport system permease large subunit
VTPLESAAVLLVLLLVLLTGGIWIAISLAAVAWFGLQFFTNSPPEASLFQSFWGSSASWTLAALPLFVWMGEILYRTKLSDEMFEGLSPWLGWLPGRLMHVNILGCAVFGTVSGSSAATCATIAKVALPELKKRGWEMSKERERDANAGLAKNGMTVHTPDAAMKAAFNKVGDQILQEWLKKAGPEGQQLIKAYRSK